jgi:hypothetical protein
MVTRGNEVGAPMKLRCSACGYQSESKAFFRRESGGLFGFKVPVCEGCNAYRATRLDQLQLFGMVLQQLVYVPIGYALTAQDEHGPLGVVFAEALILTGPLTALVHEFGHAIAARIAGLEVISVVIGRGSRAFSFRFLGCPVEVRRNVFGGGRTTFVDLRGEFSRWRLFFAIVGGPVANCVAAAMFVALAYAVSAIEPSGEVDAAVAVFSGIAFSQGLAAVLNLWPWGRGDLDDGLQRDGKLLLLLLFARLPQDDDRTRSIRRTLGTLRARRFADAEVACRELVSLEPTSPWAQSQLLHSILRNRGADAVVAYYGDHRDDFDAAEQTASEDERASVPFLNANIAWAMLNASDKSLLAMAAGPLQRALDATPDTPEVKGTHGALLIEMGEPERGASMLLDAARVIADSGDKADFCTFLARAARLTGDLERAVSFEGLRGHIVKTAAR